MDRRVVKTKRSIRNAFAQLVVSRDINDISITDVANLAQINRKTFYRYYSGIYQVMEEIENEIVGAYEMQLRTRPLQELLSHPDILLSNLSEMMNQDIEFYTNLMLAKGNGSLDQKLLVLLKQKTVELLVQENILDQQYAEMAADFAFSGIFNVFRNWLISGRTVPLEIMGQVVSTMCFEGFNGLRKAQPEE